MVPFANPDRQRELPHRHSAFNFRHNLAGRAFPRDLQIVDATQVDLAHHRHVSVRRRPELPIHLHVLHQILPAVARAHKPATHAREPAARCHHQRPLVLPRQQHVVPRQVHRPRRVPCPTSIHMRRQQRIQLQPRQQVLVRLQTHPLQHHPMVRIRRSSPWSASSALRDRGSHTALRVRRDRYTRSSSSCRASLRGRTSPRRSAGTPCPAPAGDRSSGNRPRSDIPCEHVNQIRLDPEYAVTTASFTLEVQRGSRPGLPKASPCCSSHRYMG